LGRCGRRHIVGLVALVAWASIATGASAADRDPGGPTASFTMTPAAATVGQQVDFDGMSSSDPCGIIVAWDWDLDGNGTFETSGATPNHTYAIPGTVTVQLRVTDDSNATHTATQDLVVSAAPPPPVTPSTVGLPIVHIPHAIAHLMVAGSPRQRGVHARGVALEATCDPGCIVTATGSIALPGGKKIALTKSSKTLAAGRPLKLVLVVPKRSRAALSAHFKRGRTATATIVLTTTNGLQFKKTITLAR
jgi:PKD repeat protein